MTNPAPGPFPDKSRAMRMFESLGLERHAWSLRRLHCPVPADALVLDVGSGNNPYPRANVLLDGYDETVERDFRPLIADRPTVFGRVERMPFRDNAFDFVIASHVLEHTPDPDAMLGELMRIGKAGFIETPDAFFERINPFRYHRLEVTERDGAIEIFKKPSWRHDTTIVDLYEHQAKDERFLRFTSTHPRPFYMRFYWSGAIPYRVINPETDAAWPLDETGAAAPGRISPFRLWLQRSARRLFSQTRRNRNLDLSTLLACVDCRSEKLERNGPEWTCRGCGREFTSQNGIPVMFPKGQEPS